MFLLCFAASKNDIPFKTVSCQIFSVFTDWIWEKILIDNAKDIGIVILMYDLIEFSCNYAKTTGFLW